MTGLIGPNGAGKTTLFNAICGLVRPAAGRIVFKGLDMVKLPVYRRAQLGIGRTFQVPQALSRLTVKENLLVAQRFGAGSWTTRAWMIFWNLSVLPTRLSGMQAANWR